jgi:hypothetical protein
MKPVPVMTAASAFDSHYPKVNRETWGAILDFLERNRVGLFLFGGDDLDCEAISHHTKGKPLFRKEGQMKRDLDGFDREMLTPVEKLLSKDCLRVKLTGNHEAWADALIEEQPELAGLLDFPAYLRLKERGWIVKPQGGHFQQGHLKYIHGDVLTGGANAARRALDTYVESVVFGHFHAFSSATKVLPHSAKYKWQAWATGCVGNLDASYLKNRPTGWTNGFAITEFFGNGFFNHYPVTVFKGRFAYGGRMYGRA